MLGRLAICCALAVSAVPGADDWVVLFDGASLDQWDVRARGGRSSWRIEDGSIAAIPGGVRRNDLLTKRSFRDCELEFEWKVARAGNSGVKYRLQGSYDFRLEAGEQRTAADVLLDRSYAGPTPVSVVGFEYQVADDENTPDSRRGPRWSAGAVYQYVPARKSRKAAAGVWHKARILLRGMRVEHWLDGEEVVEAQLDAPGVIWAEPGTDRAAITGMLLEQRLAESPVALQYHGTQAWYRNIRIRPLAVSSGYGCRAR